MNREPSPNAAWDSLWQRAKAADISSALCNRAHTAPAAARCRFQHDRIANLFGDRAGFLALAKACGLPEMIGMRVSRPTRAPGSCRRRASASRDAADEGDALFEASLREGAILGQGKP